MREQNDPSKFSDVPPACGTGVAATLPQRRPDMNPVNRPNMDSRLSDDRTCIDPADLEPAVDKAPRATAKPRNIKESA